MDSFVLKKQMGKLVGQRNSFLLFSMVLSVAVILLCCLLCFKKERVVIVPTSGISFWVEEGQVSNSYIEKMGIYLADLLLNRTPVDVERRNQILLEHVHPRVYHDFKKLLRQERDWVVGKGQSFFFQVENSRVENGAFIVEGESHLFLGKDKGNLISQKERKKYALQFECQNGKLLLTSVKKEVL